MNFCFDDCELDTDRYELRRHGEPVPLEPQVIDVLAHLVRNPGRLVTKEELLDTVWGDRFVGDSALASRIRDARRAVGDDGTAQRVIKTVHGRGFRFVSEVEVTGDDRAGEERPSLAPDSPVRPSRQEVRFCRAPDGTRLAYAVGGAGPPLLKAANWLTHLRADWESIVWGHWLRDLSARYRLAHYDQRASGMSDWEVDDVSFEAWVGDVAVVADAVAFDRFALLGVSQGAGIAVTYAARHPERVSHLVLYGGFARGRSARARTERERREAETMLDVVETGWGDDTSMFRQMFAAQFMPEAGTAPWDAFDRHQRLTASPENARRLLTVSSALDVTEIAPTVRVPTLVVHASEDRRVPLDQGELLAALIPGAELHVLDSPNHLLLDGEPAWGAFLDLVDAFLEVPRPQ